MKGRRGTIHILVKDLSLDHFAFSFSTFHIWCRVSWYNANGQMKRNDEKQNQKWQPSGLILIWQLLKHSRVCRPLQMTCMHFISLAMACCRNMLKRTREDFTGDIHLWFSRAWRPVPIDHYVSSFLLPGRHPPEILLRKQGRREAMNCEGLVSICMYAQGPRETWQELGKIC